MNLRDLLPFPIALLVMVLCLATAACGTAPGSSPAPDVSGAAQAASGVPSAAGTLAAGEIDLSAYSVTDPASPWVVVNKARPLAPADYEPPLTTVRGYRVHPEIAADLEQMLTAAGQDGVELTLRSAYRSAAKQATVYDGWVRSLGQARADQVSARPGHSEHQTGRAVDVGSATRPACDFEACFADTVEGRWIAAHAAEFGFLLRYTAENAAVTGFAPEGWHLRHVGRELAGYLDRAGIGTLEEAFGVPGGDRYAE